MGKRTRQRLALTAVMLSATLAGLTSTVITACTLEGAGDGAPAPTSRAARASHGATSRPQATPTIPKTTQSANLGWNINEESQKAQRQGRIAFVVPTAGKVNITVRVDVQITANRNLSLETGRLLPSQARGQATLSVGPRMKASLSGGAFKITALTADIEALTPSGVAHWAWDVTPIEAGRKTLQLAAWTVLSNNDALDELDFQRDMTVAVGAAKNDKSTLAAIGSWVADNIFPAISAFAAVAGIGGFSWWRRHRRRRVNAEQPEHQTASPPTQDSADAQTTAVDDQGAPH